MSLREPGPRLEPERGPEESPPRQRSGHSRLSLTVNTACPIYMYICMKMDGDVDVAQMHWVSCIR